MNDGNSTNSESKQSSKIGAKISENNFENVLDDEENEGERLEDIQSDEIRHNSNEIYHFNITTKIPDTEKPKFGIDSSGRISNISNSISNFEEDSARNVSTRGKRQVRAYIGNVYTVARISGYCNLLAASGAAAVLNQASVL